jgi:hypothetical protein
MKIFNFFLLKNIYLSMTLFVLIFYLKPSFLTEPSQLSNVVKSRPETTQIALSGSSASSSNASSILGGGTAALGIFTIGVNVP